MAHLLAFASLGKGPTGAGVDVSAKIGQARSAATPTPCPLHVIGSIDVDVVAVIDEDDVPCVGSHTPNA